MASSVPLGWLLLIMDDWGFGLSSTPYYLLMSLITFREISCSLLCVAVMGPGLLTHTEVTQVPPLGLASHLPRPVRGWHAARAQSLRPKLSLDFDFSPNMEEIELFDVYETPPGSGG